MPAQPQPAPAVLQEGEFQWRRLVLDDIGAVFELPKAGSNRLLLEEPRSQDEAWGFIRHARSQIFGLPLVCLRGESEDLFGIAAPVLASPKNQTAFLLGLFTEAAAAAPALRLVIRHLLWNFPLHRLYWHCPAVDELQPYRDAYASAGFLPEGVLPGHALIEERRVDVAVYGLLRSEWESSS